MSLVDYEKMIGEAVERINQYPSGTVFLAKDPFEGTAWKKLSKGDKLGYGRYFKYKVMRGEIVRVEYIGREDNNSAKYIKL